MRNETKPNIDANWLAPGKLVLVLLGSFKPPLLALLLKRAAHGNSASSPTLWPN